MRGNWSVILSGAAALTLATLSGCYEEGEPPAPAAQAPAPPEQPQPQMRHSGAASALGGAQRAAQGVASDLEQRQQEIADSIDDS